LLFLLENRSAEFNGTMPQNAFVWWSIASLEHGNKFGPRNRACEPT